MVHYRGKQTTKNSWKNIQNSKKEKLTAT
jgi:hypothetical protein